MPGRAVMHPTFSVLTYSWPGLVAHSDSEVCGGLDCADGFVARVELTAQAFWQ